MLMQGVGELGGLAVLSNCQWRSDLQGNTKIAQRRIYVSSASGTVLRSNAHFVNTPLDSRLKR